MKVKIKDTSSLPIKASKKSITSSNEKPQKTTSSSSSSSSSSSKPPTKRLPKEPHPLDHDAKIAASSIVAHSILTKEYGKPKRFQNLGVDSGDGCGSVRTSVLDSLVRTILSQNTTDKTSYIAFQNLKKALPTWSAVLHAKEGIAEDAVRCGGLADAKMERVRIILSTILTDYSQHCIGLEPNLEFLHLWSNDRIKTLLSSFKGVGPKTIACVLMFTMNREEMPVDTHVWKIAKNLKWVRQSDSREVTYEVLNRLVPGEIKYDLHVLLVQHGKALKNELGVLKVMMKGSKIKEEDDGDDDEVEEKPKKVESEAKPTRVKSEAKPTRVKSEYVIPKEVKKEREVKTEDAKPVSVKSANIKNEVKKEVKKEEAVKDDYVIPKKIKIKRGVKKEEEN